MTIVMNMSTDPDIINTQLNIAWGPITRYTWAQVSQMNIGIANAATIVVIAHGNGTEIGNSHPGGVDVNAETFLALVQGNMNAGVPASIYISTCGHQIAEFAAAVRIAADNNQIWNATSIYGHSDPVAGPVPPPNDIRWYEIY